MPVNWPIHAKDFLSDDPRKKVMPISGDFEEWCATPCQKRSMSEAIDVRGARCQGRSMSGALDLVRGQALIDIERQPALLVHLVGVGKPDGQIVDERAQLRVGLAELAPHSGGINDVYHRVGGRDRPCGALTFAKDRGHFAKQLAGLQRRQHQPLARDEFHGAGVD